MSKDWTLDTYVLYKAAEVDYDAIALLNKIILGGHLVAFDAEGHIEQEYRKCITKAQRNRTPGCVALGKWFKVVVNKLAFKCCGKLHTKHRNKLKKLRFDTSDWPFVAVCFRTACRRLVAEESDYTEEVIDCLKNDMEICVLCIKDSLMI